MKCWQDINIRNKINTKRNAVMQTAEYKNKQAIASRGRSRCGTTITEAANIRYRYLCGEKPKHISQDFPKIALSTLKKICGNVTWKHLPNTKEELYNMLISCQAKEESLEGSETREVIQNG